MKVVFAHDHVFKESLDGNLYTAGSFNNEVWKRYLNHFDEIIVAARLDSKKVEAINKYNNFDLHQTSFLPIPSLSGPIAQFKNKSEAIEKIKKALIESDALIARLPSEIGNLSIGIAQEMGKPFAVEVVACVWDALWNYGKLQAKIYAPIAFNKMKRAIYNAPYAIYVTNDFLQERYPCSGKIENVSNVEIKDVMEASLEKRLESLNLPKEKYNIGMIGNLNNRIKGWDIALKAIGILNKKGIDFQFHILGDGNKEKWNDMARSLGVDDKLTFTGVLPSGEPVFNWLDKIDVYIQPSFQEGLPRAVIEAMSRGCPVVGSAAGGIPELIDNSCIHRVGDFEGLADSLLNIITNRNFAKEIAVKNHIESRRYQKNILDKKRNNFWNEFLNHINSN
ncbi:glycosyltransferase family 4 protein [Alkalihalobacillus trypoxylicola]|uniref:Glycosyl transferase family 1 n=1 Tax=Alkalihalobacillus trypoxylicola TaxID=519424 RepID=A0A162DQU2_9BACI|nr:glycosyltransferase [Alkalihalobacillus trypoxylicola]KYG30596.1 hypothetical protein AZF04_19305 [Alkalihalobacillus trypoxylicola]